MVGHRRGTRRVATLAAVTLAMTAIAPVAQGAVAEASTPDDYLGMQTFDSKEGDSVFVFDAEAVTPVAVGSEVFYPTGEVDPDTLIVIPDDKGNYPGGRSASELATVIHDEGLAALESLDQAPIEVTPTAFIKSLSFAIPPMGTSATYESTTGYISDTTVYYDFSTVPGANTSAHGYGRGFYRGYNGSDFGVWSTYRWVGYSTGSTVGKSVVWENVLAYKRFYAKTSSPHVVTGRWSG